MYSGQMPTLVGLDEHIDYAGPQARFPVGGIPMSTYGRNSTVRSHRRGGARRRINLAPWFITGAVVLLVAAGATAGYTYFVKDSCSGQSSAAVVVTPKLEAIMKSLGRS